MASSDPISLLIQMRISSLWMIMHLCIVHVSSKELWQMQEYKNGVASKFTWFEHYWTCLGYAWQGITNRNPPIQTIQELRVAIVDGWNQIPLHKLRRLIASCSRRCQAVIASWGEHTEVNTRWLMQLWPLCFLSSILIIQTDNEEYFTFVNQDFRYI